MSTDNRIELRMQDLEQRVAALEKTQRDGLWDKNSEIVKREEKLVVRYGELVDKTKAAEILGVTRATIYAMLADGRIKAMCGGRRVSVRSIAAYMCAKNMEELA